MKFGSIILFAVFLAAGAAGIRICTAGEGDNEHDDVIGISWVDIPDSNADFPASGRPAGSGFTGEMSRYQITNAQYARYLNSALATGDIEVKNHQVKGKTGDYAGRNYYRLDGPGYTGLNATGGGASRIKYSGGTFTVLSGFENHPVTYVSWYGAAAFAVRYGWRLPAECEWESVANYSDGRAYATGRSLAVSGPDETPEDGIAREHGGEWRLANYWAYQAAEYGTTPAGYFGYYGYGLADMSGNVWEWTSTALDNFRVFRGGSWVYHRFGCMVARRHGLNYGNPAYQSTFRGFRVCR